MKKKSYVFISLIAIFFLLFYYVLISDKCKPLTKILVDEKLQSVILKECISQFGIRKNIKMILANNEILFRFGSQFVNEFFPNFGKKNIFEIEGIKTVADNIYFEKKNNVKGIINNKKELEKISVLNTQKINFDNWFRSHGNNFNNKYTKTIDIKQENLINLKLISKFDSIEDSNLNNTWKSNIGVNPIFAEGKIFFVTASWELVAISADNYSIVWSKDFKSTITKRGFLYHKDKIKDKGFIFINAGKYLYKLNSSNGSLVKEFGEGGMVEVGNVLIPPVVYKNQIIVSNINRSDVVSIDLISGKKNYSKNLHGKDGKGDYGYFKSTPWGGAALDDKNGIYFVVTGNPRPAVVGIVRPGDNKNSCSIIAFDLKNKKILWEFQDVIHDLWDYDISAPPVIANIKIEEFIIEVVIVTTKTGNTYVFDRKTGKSLFDINYKNTEKSNIPNEFTAPQQPEPSKPKKFASVEFKKEDLREVLLKDKKFMEYFEQNYTYGYFKPPALGKEVIFYGLVGGNNWVGSAYDPETQNLYVPSNHVPAKIKVTTKSNEKELIGKYLKYHSLYKAKCASCHGATRNGKYQEIAGYNLKQGRDLFFNKIYFSKNKDLSKREYIPSLVGLTLFDDLKDKMKPFSEMIKLHNKQLDISEDDYEKIRELFVEWDKKLVENNNINLVGSWEMFLAEDGKFISKPPWGTISSINISDGTTNWKKPFGFDNEEEIGLFNYGGVSITSSNLLIATGANDNYVIIKDKTNGKTLWKYKMDARGTAAPLIYNHNGKSFIAVLATGGMFPKSNKASSLYIFGIK